MNEKQRLVYLNGVHLLVQIELQGMLAENAQRLACNESPAYVEKDFANLIKKHRLDHSELVHVIYGT